MLTTAEMYIAAVLSKDKVLMDVFKNGEDFHSSIAKIVFNLPCSIDQVKELYPNERQAAKAVSFGILYGAAAGKISEQVTKASGTLFTRDEAQEVIDQYFEKFPQLAKWIEGTKKFIRTNGFVYSFFGRKRRLQNVKSDDKGLVAHEIRSGLNFLVQSVASDVNLLACIDANTEIKASKMDARIFALVHDSILAEVKDEDVDAYVSMVSKYITMDRGLNIPGCPIGFDVEIADDYSKGKFDEYYDFDNELQDAT